MFALVPVKKFLETAQMSNKENFGVAVGIGIQAPLTQTTLIELTIYDKAGKLPELKRFIVADTEEEAKNVAEQIRISYNNEH